MSWWVHSFYLEIFYLPIRFLKLKGMYSPRLQDSPRHHQKPFVRVSFCKNWEQLEYSSDVQSNGLSLAFKTQIVLFVCWDCHWEPDNYELSFSPASKAGRCRKWGWDNISIPASSHWARFNNNSSNAPGFCRALKPVSHMVGRWVADVWSFSSSIQI